MADMRAKIIKLIVAKAQEHGIEPFELLGGMIAEGLDPHASRPVNQADWRRYWEPPDPRFDVSFGLGQKNVRYSDEYAAWCRSQGFEPTDPRADAYPGDDVIAAIRDAYFDPAHALDVAAQGYRYWRFDPPVSALQAWTAYNLPASYKMWPNVPNVEQRDNYAAGLAEAQAILGAAPMPTLTYNPDAPIDLQTDPFSCSEQSAQWLLRSIGRNPGDAWIRDQFLHTNPPLMTPEYGLMDASGASLAAWLQSEYGDEMGLTFTSKNGASWDDLAAIAGTQPVMIGGRSWNHWSGVRRLKDDGLEIANPAPNWKDVGVLLDHAEFDRYGSWSYVTVADGAAPPPPPDAPPVDWRSELAAMFARHDAEFGELMARQNIEKQDLLARVPA